MDSASEVMRVGGPIIVIVGLLVGIAIICLMCYRQKECCYSKDPCCGCKSPVATV